MKLRSASAASAALALVLLTASRGDAQATLLPSLAGSPAPTITPLAAPARESHGAEGLGRSGSLRVAILKALDALDIVEPFAGPDGTEYRWHPIFGTRAPVLGTPVPSRDIRAPDGPGTWRLEALHSREGGVFDSLTVLAPTPFTAKAGGYLNGYHIGTYPTEGAGRTDEYAPPTGFLEVTPANQDLQISEHFRLRQFLTKDQFDVWPKYVALDTRLLDKLELVIQELNRMGVRADRYFIMSGYRTPQYNGPGGDGRAALSRHMYGDAADGWVDNDGDGRMDDLNGDGHIDIRDAEVIRRAVDRVEEKYPELVGGCGVYVATSAHGPFIHIDARGYRARW
jgi:uncharacterized protein YcbK (DUF882 family)